jgi:hypothetical protein
MRQRVRIDGLNGLDRLLGSPGVRDQAMARVPMAQTAKAKPAVLSIRASLGRGDRPWKAAYEGPGTSRCAGDHKKGDRRARASIPLCRPTARTSRVIRVAGPAPSANVPGHAARARGEFARHSYGDPYRGDPAAQSSIGAKTLNLN